MVSIPSTADRISRWTPAFFACAVINFALAQLLVIAGISWPAAPASSGATLAAVHLLTIGWVSLLMFGALFQFVPVLTGQRIWRQPLALVALVLVELGLACMVGGFFLAGASNALLLPLGGCAVILGMFAAGLNLAAPLARKRPLPLSARFLVAGLVLLLLTVLLGLSFALALTVPALKPAASSIIAGGLEYHVLAGVGGWFTLTAIGVSYELLPMFMLAPRDRGRFGQAILWTVVAGFAALFGGALIGVGLGDPAGAALEQAGWAAILAAIGLYLIDVARLYRDRRRRRIELHNQAAIGAFVALGIALAATVAAVAMNDLGRAAPTLVFLLILGWLSGLGLSQLYKIVPFLAWLARFGHQLGTGRVPRVQDLVNEQTARYMFVGYFASVAVGAIATFLDVPSLTRAAMVVTLTTTVLLGREYWRAWYGHYAASNPVPQHLQSQGRAS